MTTKTVLFLFVMATIAIGACMQAEQQPVQTAVAAEWSADDERALGLLKSNCTSCHHPNRETVMAPSLHAIRLQYLDAYKSEGEFVNRLVGFVKNPSKDLSMMPGAIDKYGAMPRQALPDADLQAIAAFMFRHDPLGIK